MSDDISFGSSGYIPVFYILLSLDRLKVKLNGVIAFEEIFPIPFKTKKDNQREEGTERKEYLD